MAAANAASMAKVVTVPGKPSADAVGWDPALGGSEDFEPLLKSMAVAVGVGTTGSSNAHSLYSALVESSSPFPGEQGESEDLDAPPAGEQRCCTVIVPVPSSMVPLTLD